MKKMGEVRRELRRWLLLLVGLAVMAFGIAFSINAALGTSPLSSLPQVLSLFTPLTVGTATIAMHCVFILCQILILRRQYRPIQLLQLPVALAFGGLCDFALWVIQRVQPAAYWQQWALCIVGVVLVAVGVSFEVMADVVTLAGEGLVLAICRVTPIKFGYMKVIFDVALVICACVVSLAFLGRLEGVREGTVAAAVLVGLIAKRLNQWLEPLREKYL